MGPVRNRSQRDFSGHGDSVGQQSGAEEARTLGQLGAQLGLPGAQDALYSGELFEGKSAWFSTSVDNTTKQLWKDNGGTETDFENAQFIFSADNCAPDTVSVFESAEYIMQHLMLFHSQYITDAVRDKHMPGRHTVLGYYVLPPQDIVNEVRKHVKLCWDIADEDNGSGRPQAQAGGVPGERQVSRAHTSPADSAEEDEDPIHLLRQVKLDSLHDFVAKVGGADVYSKAVG